MSEYVHVFIAISDIKNSGMDIRYKTYDASIPTRSTPKNDKLVDRVNPVPNISQERTGETFRQFTKSEPANLSWKSISQEIGKAFVYARINIQQNSSSRSVYD